MNSFYENIATQLNELASEGNLRKLPDCGKRQGIFLQVEGRNYLNFSSNDYLSLTQRPDLIAEFYQNLANKDFENIASPGSTGSRLLSGNHYLFDVLEKNLTKLYNHAGSASEVLVFNSGYHTNLGILPAITSKKDLILSDKLNHASIIDGFRLAEADFLRYRHNDYEHLENILKTKRSQYRNVIIVSESLFSMDGDIANLQTIIDIKNRHNALLYLDEAHSFGTIGPQGLGIAAQYGVLNEVDILVATFGKAIGGLGAFALVKPVLKEFLINRMRSLIFSTALPPIMLSWLIFAIQKVVKMDAERNHLQDLSNQLRDNFINAGLKTLGNSQIVPLITGSNQSALDLASKLRSKGVIALPIRPPTVPPGSARLRFSLTSAMSQNDIQTVTDIIISQ